MSCTPISPVKGSREIKFGHKVNVGTGKSNLILVCEVIKGTPADSTLFQNTIDKLIESYGIIPRDSATDGGYASKANADHAKDRGSSR
jgi:IS5 family transposase